MINHLEMQKSQLLFLITALIILSCGPGREKSGSSAPEQDTLEKEAPSSDQAMGQSWIDESEMDNLSNTWVDEADAGELSTTWTEDAFSDELSDGSGLANSWVDESGEMIYKKAEIPPEFIGGKEALFNYFINNLTYPDDVEEGVVYVAFVVGSDGMVRDARVFKGVKESMDKEALRLIENMPDWDPGLMGGKPVSSVYGLPVIFRP